MSGVRGKGKELLAAPSVVLGISHFRRDTGTDAIVCQVHPSECHFQPRDRLDLHNEAVLVQGQGERPSGCCTMQRCGIEHSSEVNSARPHSRTVNTCAG